MKKINVLIFGLGLASLSGGMSSALSQNDYESRQATRQSGDAVLNAQTVRETSVVTRPSRKRTNTTVLMSLPPRTQSPLHLLLKISPIKERY